MAAFTVGRARHLAALSDDLRFIADGGYKIRLLVGDWGFGKTHPYRVLVYDFGWTHDEWIDWTVTAVAEQVFAPPDAARVHPPIGRS